MKNKAILYLHGFNSASLDINGNLLTSKEKLLVMQAFCEAKAILFDTPNVDYRDFQNIVETMLFKSNQYFEQDYQVIFMGSSMGGFASEYLAMKTGCPAIMINPAIKPSELLQQFIGATANDATNQSYYWDQNHCDQYLRYEQELAGKDSLINRTILLDRADELIDAEITIAKYQTISNVLAFDGGSHSFEHMRQALAFIEPIIDNF